MKIAIVKPIHKRGNAEEYENYRPISILPSFAKIFETASCNQIMEYLIHRSIISNNQHGYLKGRSIKTAVYYFIKKITDAFEDRNLALGLFLDLSKAYDCLNYRILTKKLKRYGIGEIVLKWIESYFEDRKQIVDLIQDETTVRSEVQGIKLGIPQGSIEGPLFTYGKM